MRDGFITSFNQLIKEHRINKDNVYTVGVECQGKVDSYKLKENGILIRHFGSEKICQYNRITIGTADQMDALVLAIRKILEEK